MKLIKKLRLDHIAVITAMVAIILSAIYGGEDKEKKKCDVSVDSLAVEKVAEMEYIWGADMKLLPITPVVPVSVPDITKMPSIQAKKIKVGGKLDLTGVNNIACDYKIIYDSFYYSNDAERDSYKWFTFIAKDNQGESHYINRTWDKNKKEMVMYIVGDIVCKFKLIIHLILINGDFIYYTVEEFTDTEWEHYLEDIEL